MKPEFATNRPGETVAQALTSLLQHLLEIRSQPFEVAIAAPYFNPEGFALVADPLEKVGDVRLLLGVQPTAAGRFRRHLDSEAGPADAEKARLRNALAGHIRSIEEDRDLLGFESLVDVNLQRLVEWLRSGRVDVRRFEEGFLHGKAFIATTHDEGVIAGSSNFTSAGLAVNRELNLGQYQPSVVRKVTEWFEELWQDASAFDLAAIYEGRFLPHTPYVVYLRMLWERYGEEIEEEAGDTGIHLTQFQRDGLFRAKRILADHHGVLIADGVGLGKTFLAGELIREATIDRRQRVLLVSPAALRDGPWRSFMNRHNLFFKSISFEQLSDDRQLSADGTGDHLGAPFDQYAMVVIDEGHAYRNPLTLGSKVLQTLLRGTPPKDLVFLTATPVNNSLWDLYYLLFYFIKSDSAFADSGIRSLREHFGHAAEENPDDLSPDRLFDVLDAVAVRRTRHFVKRYYPHDRVEIGGRKVPIMFPKPTVQNVSYSLDKVMPGFFERFAHALICNFSQCEHGEPISTEPTLTLARYVPSNYLASGEPDAHELQMAGLLRSGLLKRFESSTEAFAQTCARMIKGHDAFIEILERGYVASGDALNEWVVTDSDELEDLESRIASTHQPAALFDEERLRNDVESDRRLLRQFMIAARKVTPDKDPKLRALVKELTQIAEKAREEALDDRDEQNKRKVIVFTYYSDTVKWIEEHLKGMVAAREELAPYQDRLISISGGDRDRSDAIFGFAPVSSEAPPGRESDLYDAMISTDVLAEGMNLQQARHIINYDLPWNPMRLVQRHGRIDRIGSEHPRVWIRCFLPDDRLDALLGLQETLHRKIAQAAQVIGVEGEILPGSRVTDVVFAETREEIEKLRDENPGLFESGGERGHAYSGEEYRQELRSGLQNPDLANLVRRLPGGSGSGIARPGENRGFVFCAKVGDHPTPQFRYIDSDEPSSIPVRDTLTCLSRANATAETLRVLDEKTHHLAYEAWANARAHIFEEWQKASDPAYLRIKLPKAMRDAAEILRKNTPPGIDRLETDRLVDAVESPYPFRIQATIRDAIRSSDNPIEQAKAIAEKVIELGLEPSPPPEVLPVISIEDVHLVCWMAIVPDN